MPALSFRSRAAMAAFFLCALSALPVQAQKTGGEYRPEVGQPGKDVVWVPTPDEVVDKMLDMAELKAGERLVDLGSGDGKIAIAAAKRGARARGIEFNPDMVALSRRKAAEAGVKVDLQQGDIFKSDFSNADVITMYLLPSLNERLRPILLRMKPGTRITSHQFMMGDWAPDETATVGSRQAHLWIVPAQLAGRWQLRINGEEEPIEVRLQQRNQVLDGTAQWHGRAATLADARVRGTKVAFTLVDADGASHRFEGRADGANRLRGEVVAKADGRRQAFVASR
jgi:SAM-dependent methyltransferase